MGRSLFFFLTLFATLLGDDHTKYGLGYLKEEEVRHLESRVEKVVKVKPNSLSKQRSGDDSLEENPSQEFHSIKASIKAANALMKKAPASALPIRVNNSLLPFFPPIGDQGPLGSCVAWGSTYYQTTHEMGLANGYNNKTSQMTTYSPKWTYDLINDGFDQGSSVIDAYNLLSGSGAPSIVKFPYDTNYTAWDLKTDDWIDALSARTAPYVLIPGLNGNLTAIKQSLANGHVLTFATYINSWVFTVIKQDPNRPTTPHQGEYAAVYMNGRRGGHFMTIVGYDDDLWIDVNGNGVEDPGERGAFLIANSWGSSWGNNGFIWISYDAFLPISKVKRGPTRGRIPAGEYLNSSVIAISPKAVGYKPKLVAKFSLTQNLRNQIGITLGSSAVNKNVPAKSIPLFALANQGGAYNFSGQRSNLAQTVVFAADLTDLMALSPQRYYLTTSDNTRQNPTTLNSFTLVDLVNKTEISSSGLPKTYDYSQGSAYIDYTFKAGK